MKTFAAYKPRSVEFNQLAKVGRWSVKVYTITNRSAFGSAKMLESALLQLPKWLEKSKGMKLPTYDNAFLIVHEGSDGVWTLINWWIGGNMLQGLTFFTSFDTSDEFKLTPNEGSMACVWELAVISFERAMWVEYILKKSDRPDFAGYAQKYINQVV